MTDQPSSKANRIAIILAIIAFVLALSAALIKYIRFGEVDIAVLAAGIAIPAVVISIAMTSKKISKK
jgi:hypothetical protein